MKHQITLTSGSRPETPEMCAFCDSVSLDQDWEKQLSLQCIARRVRAREVEPGVAHGKPARRVSRALIGKPVSTFAGDAETASAETRHRHIMNTELDQSEKTLSGFRRTPCFAIRSRVRETKALRQGWICPTGGCDANDVRYPSAHGRFQRGGLC